MIRLMALAILAGISIAVLHHDPAAVNDLRTLIGSVR